MQDDSDRIPKDTTIQFYQDSLNLSNLLAAVLQSLLSLLKISSLQINRRKDEWYIKPRSTHWANTILNDPKQFPDDQFKKTFRMTRSTFENLHSKLAHRIEGRGSNFREPIPPRHRLLMYLYHVGQGINLRETGEKFGCGKSTAGDMVRLVTEAINSVMFYDYVKIPTKEEFTHIAVSFENRYHIPQCGGCIDGSHFAIIKPVHHGSDYFNRKNYYSINCQGKHPLFHSDKLNSKGSFSQLLLTTSESLETS